MAIYWITESVPLPVTALMPLVIFPLMGISKAKDISQEYYKDIIFVFLGGFSVAIAFEKWNVHKRFALRLLLLLGSSPKRLMLGFILTTSILSMWMSNTATTAMMVPIAKAVLTQLFKVKKITSIKTQDDAKEKEKLEIYVDDGDINTILNDIRPEEGKYKWKEVSNSREDDIIDFENLDKESQSLCKGVYLCICYAANCGGVATLTGTVPNLVIKGQIDLLSDGKSGITFLTWFVFCFPLTVLCVLVCWLVLQLMLFGWRDLVKSSTRNSSAVADVIRKEHKKLGNLSFAEKAVVVHLVILVMLWFTLDPDFIPGWASFFPSGYVSDAVPAIFILFMLFIFPSEWNTKKRNNVSRGVPCLLNWQIMSEKFPWGVTILLGGGFALARVCRESGLSDWLASQLAVFSSIPPWAMVLIICIIVSFCTEVISNTAVCTIFLPILADLAIGMEVHPVYLMLPAGICSSLAFMLPVATPPNIIVFSCGYLKVIDMVKIGFIINMLCVLVVTLGINTWGRAYFDLDVFPEWGRRISRNVTNLNTSFGVNNITDKTIANLSNV